MGCCDLFLWLAGIPLDFCSVFFLATLLPFCWCGRRCFFLSKEVGMFLRESWDVYAIVLLELQCPTFFLTDGHGEMCVFLSSV